MEEGRDLYRGLFGKSEGKRPKGIPRCRWEDNKQINLQVVVSGDMECIGLAEDRDR
jgi:hypothetical protein